ncbi:hypothetical protein CYMTET_22707 [Cymbomonas tetramitiformis]|uniref:Uncharacterized protein n=1 Tax=Cymbomonas tetramitiformis TaxID=36881 RepID=A0AAE0G074_9CHLO|nr:hypothetical protein CYMTET_22707 [Cymbomonas tetramitiformis]
MVVQTTGDESVERAQELDEVRPGDKIEVFWPEDREWNPETVGDTGENGKTTIKYNDGDVEELVLKEERYRVPPSVTTEGKQREWLPASATTVQLFVASLRESDGGSGAADITRRPQTGTAMPRESLLRDSNGLSTVLEKEKGWNDAPFVQEETLHPEGGGGRAAQPARPVGAGSG